MRFLLVLVAASCVAVLATWSPALAAPAFTLSYISGTSTQAQTAFAQAANVWSSLFADHVTVNLTVGTGTLGSGILASASSAESTFTYTGYRTALIADQSSANDSAAVASTPAGSSFSVYMNYTSDNPHGVGSATPFLDGSGSNTTFITMTNANAKALGLTPAAQTVGGCGSNCDGYIQFSNAFSYDFDPSNGITAGGYDFVGLAIHEIGHALGFVSGVDVLDVNASGTASGAGTVNGYYGSNAFTFVSPLDMFRCSAGSVSAGADLDFTADNRTKNFSLNDCVTSLGAFSTGITHGDGRQASHWKDNLDLGIMDPIVTPGQLLTITPLDLIAFDVIGWDLAVPEPPSLALGAAWMAGLLTFRRRRPAVSA
ncbi:MAG: NF038122 family metalloprotease [Acetobacteraceae bacterium]